MKAILLFFCALWLSVSAFAQDLGLAEALDRAARDNSDLRAQRFQELQSAADIKRVDGEFGPHIEMLLGGAPITKATGNASLSKEDKHVIGRIFIGKITLTQPIYTWGRKGNYEKAAEAGVKVKEAESRQKELQLRYEVKEAYFGYQFANSLLDFIGGGKGELTKALAERKQKKQAAAKEKYRLQIFLHDVEGREAEISKYFQLAQEGFALRVGAERGAAIPKEKWLIPVKREKKSVEYYIEMAAKERPEFQQLDQGKSAKRNLAIAEKKGRWPILAGLTSYDLADTNVRTVQTGAFAYDPYNKSTFTIGVGFKLDFQWGLQEAKASKFQAEADELEAKEIYARQGIATEVRKAYLELEEAEKRLQAATEGYKVGKQWLTGEAIGYGSGLGDAKGLVEAYGARAETAKNYFDAVYHHHLAWANLSKVVGAEVDPAIASL
ncbi:MAG: TolC family protein [Bacteriovoracia bacterium]